MTLFGGNHDFPADRVAFVLSDLRPHEVLEELLKLAIGIGSFAYGLVNLCGLLLRNGLTQVRRRYLLRLRARVLFVIRDGSVPLA